jgi:hypothetical protein
LVSTTNSKAFNRRRRGVGAIIGGVILAAILVTTVLVYFVTILNNEKAKTSYEIQAQQEDRNKDTENFTVNRALSVTADNLAFNVENRGPIPLVASRALVYCEMGCDDFAPTTPMETLSLDEVLSPGETFASSTGSGDLISDNSHKYRIDIISDRGNIVSSIPCTVEIDGTCLEDEGDDPTGCPECAGTAEKIIAQQTGSLQLEFKSFAAIYPRWGSINDVDQKGFDVQNGNATGYPGSAVLRQDRVVLVERMRNLDPSTEDMMLTRQTGLAVTLGKATSGQPTTIYLCTPDLGAKMFTPWTEGSPNLPLTYTVPGTPAPEGFQNFYFCSKDKQGETNWWDNRDSTKFDPLNGVFMVARGWLGATGETSETYSQTIPYQSLFVTPTALSCLKTNVPSNSAECDLLLVPSVYPTTGSSIGGNRDSDLLKYSATVAELEAGLPIKLRVETPRSGVTYSVDWVYPVSGKHFTMVKGAMLTTASNEVIITPPSTMPDGIKTIEPGKYTIQLTSSFYKANPSDDQFQQDAFFMTFEVTP